MSPARLCKVCHVRTKEIPDLADRTIMHPFAGASRLKHVNQEVWKKRLRWLRILFTVDKEAKRVVIRLIDLRDDDTYEKKKLDQSINWEPPST